MKITKETMKDWLIEREKSDKLLINSLIIILQIQKDSCERQIKLLMQNHILK
jgi:hypothetical protein